MLRDFYCGSRRAIADCWQSGREMSWTHCQRMKQEFDGPRGWTGGRKKCSRPGDWLPG